MNESIEGGGSGSFYVSRRRLLAAGAGTLLASRLWPGALAAEGVDAGTFRFVVLNDLHYFDDKCGPFFERVVRHLKTEIKDKPGGLDLVLLAGDLSDWGQAFQFAAVRDIFKQVGVPVHVVCGNHDWNDWDDRRAYLDLYGDSLNYAFEHKGWQFVALDSTNHNLKSRVNVPPETLGWLDGATKKLDKQRPTIAFTHFPMSPGLQWPAANAADVLDRFRNYNLQQVYGGHCHAFREHQVGDTLVQTNRCCSFRVPNHDRNQPEKGFFLCEAKDGKVRRTFVEVKTG